MHGGRSRIVLTLLLMSIQASAGCAGVQFGRAFVNVPLFEQQGDLALGGGLSNQGGSIHASYAVTDRVGTFGSLGYVHTPDAWFAGVDLGAGPYWQGEYFAAEGFVLVGAGTGQGISGYHEAGVGRASHVDLGVQGT